MHKPIFETIGAQAFPDFRIFLNFLLEKIGNENRVKYKSCTVKYKSCTKFDATNMIQTLLPQSIPGFVAAPYKTI